MATQTSMISVNDSLDKLVAYQTSQAGISAKSIRRTIMKHALFAATTAGTIGIVPGGSFVATAIINKCTKVMYRKITGDLRFPFHMSLMKKAGGMILSKVINSVVTNIVAMLAYLIPGAGNAFASALCATSAFTTVYISGRLYVVFLERMCAYRAKKYSEITEQDIEAPVEEILESADFNALMKEAKAAHKEAKKDRALNDFSDIEDEINGESEEYACA